MVATFQSSITAAHNAIGLGSLQNNGMSLPLRSAQSSGDTGWPVYCGLWTVDSGKTLDFSSGEMRDFCTGPVRYSRIGPLVGAFFAASSDLLLLVRLDLAPADWAQDCNGFDFLG